MASPSDDSSSGSSDKTPQAIVSEFWDKFVTKKPGKVTSIFPRSLYATLLPRPHDPRTSARAHNAAESYEAAAEACRQRVKRIASDCRRSNTKFTDGDFDIKGSAYDCLLSLGWVRPREAANPREIASALETLADCRLVGVQQELNVRVAALQQMLRQQPVTGEDDGGGGGGWSDDFVPRPQSTHRVGWIFEDPHFTVDGFSSSDIKQGAGALDCWWLSAVATVCHRADLMDKLCVARDEACGVYGFVFYRDGEWVPAVVDDYLFLQAPDFEDTGAGFYDPGASGYHKYRRDKQRGSDALYFTACADQNETWLPLMEKAYAKAHGDYGAIWGGWVGEAVEDLTGGVATEMAVEDVLDTKRLWAELLNAESDFVFGLDILADSDVVRNGLAVNHAYSILQAREETGEDGKAVQLVKIRNPWGSRGGDGVGEWSGSWSDGSKEWTPYWLTKLDYKFGDDGVFWMTYQDMLLTFTNLHRTRIFDKTWTVVQEWTSVDVAWITGYLQRKFIVEVKQAGVVVLVLSQLDDRYFRGLRGQYSFLLHFVLQKEGAEPGDYVCRARPKSENFARACRSISCEAELQPGRYEVLPKLTATRDVGAPTIEDMVKDHAETRPQKLRQVGLNFDLAHAKAGVPDEDQLLVAKREESKKRAAEQKEKEEGKQQQQQQQQGTQTADEAPKKAEEPGATAPPPPPGEQDAAAQEGPGGGDLPPDAPAMIASSGPADAQGADEEDGCGEDMVELPPPGAEGGEPDDKDKPLPSWNAVCVMGLRVYAKDPDVTITLDTPKDAQQAASVTVDEKTPAGATM